MAGQMGAVRNTTQNLQVVAVDDAEGIILVHGAVSGPKNGWVLISDAVKSPLPEAAPFPAGLMNDFGENSIADRDILTEAKANEVRLDEAVTAEDTAPTDDADQSDADKD